MNASTVPELAKRWRCRVKFVRNKIADGTLAAFTINGTLRIAPEVIAAVEQGPLAVRPSRRRKREVIPREVLEMLGE